MKVLVVGSGGREHALAWKIAQSPLVSSVITAPGNPGMAALGPYANVSTDDLDGIVKLAKRERVGLVMIGPEGALAGGLAERLQEAGIPAFGPSSLAARLESSKVFTKDFCTRHNIPTARYGTFRGVRDAKKFLRMLEPPYVLKADGLAAGKGVVIAASLEEAEAEIDAFLKGKFGTASQTIVIEEFLQGEEASFFVLADGETALPMAGAQDHKRARDGDKGPNTGGMGAYSPAPVLDNAMSERVMDEIIRPTLAGMAKEGAPFSGVLYAGLMIGPEGPKLIEYNVRFGDPECQVLMARLKSDLIPLLLGCAKGELGKAPSPVWLEGAAVTVVMAAKGYPGKYAKGGHIEGMRDAEAVRGVTVFHAGTARDDKAALIANSGRVLNVTATGADLREAVDRAYAATGRIRWKDGFYRSDIGWRALERE